MQIKTEVTLMDNNKSDKLKEITQKIIDLKDEDAISVLANVVDVVCKYEMLTFNDLQRFAKTK